MRINEIKKTKTVEEVLRTEYIAEDGKIFYNEEEARKYEESARFMLSKELKRLNKEGTTHYDFHEGNDDSMLEIFDIRTEKDLENLKRYIYLEMQHNGASEVNIKDCFSSEERKNWAIDNITAGHEVLIFWSYDKDWVWTYGNGSIEGYFDWIRENYKKIISQKEEKKEN